MVVRIALTPLLAYRYFTANPGQQREHHFMHMSPGYQRYISMCICGYKVCTEQVKAAAVYMYSAPDPSQGRIQGIPQSRRRVNSMMVFLPNLCSGSSSESPRRYHALQRGGSSKLCSEQGGKSNFTAMPPRRFPERGSGVPAHSLPEHYASRSTPPLSHPTSSTLKLSKSVPHRLMNTH